MRKPVVLLMRFEHGVLKDVSVHASHQKACNASPEPHKPNWRTTSRKNERVLDVTPSEQWRTLKRRVL